MKYRIEELVDVERYPLHDPSSDACAELLKDRQRAWREDGVFALPGLIQGDSARRAAAELHRPMGTIAFAHRHRHNIYFTDDTAGLPADLAGRHLNTAHRTLTCDQMDGTIIRAVYEWDPLREFIRRALGLPALYRMHDPMACLNVMAYGEGEGLDWHFDRAEFAVTIMLQAADAGGEFEYRRGLRTASDPNHHGVRRLLAGEDEQVRRGRSAPGDMTVFAGFGSAHRVTPVRGARSRMMAVLSFMTEPGYEYGSEDRLRFYGRSSPAGQPAIRRAQGA